MKGKHGFYWYHRNLSEEYIHLLINYKKKLLYDNVSEKSIHQYLKQLGNYFEFLQKKNINPLDATVEIIEEYLDTFEVSESREKVIISILSGYYKHLKRRGYIKQDIIKEYKKLGTDK